MTGDRFYWKGDNRLTTVCKADGTKMFSLHYHQHGDKLIDITIDIVRQMNRNATEIMTHG